MERILEIEDLKKYYGRQPNQTKALDGISFRVLKGEFLGIMGSSGSGKSTLLQLYCVCNPAYRRQNAYARAGNPAAQRRRPGAVPGQEDRAIFFRILNCWTI